MMVFSASILFWFTIFIIYSYLHEFAGHYLINWLSGVSPDQMEILWAETSNIKFFPFGVNIPGVTASETSQISRSSGGFVAGVLLILATLALRKMYNKKKQFIYFCFHSITLGFALAGIAEGIIEGFFLEYHRGAVETIILFSCILGLPTVLIIRPSVPKIISYFRRA